MKAAKTKRHNLQRQRGHLDESKKCGMSHGNDHDPGGLLAGRGIC